MGNMEIHNHETPTETLKRLGINLTQRALETQYGFNRHRLERMRQRKRSVNILIAEDKSSAMEAMKTGCEILFGYFGLKAPKINTINAIEKVERLPEDERLDVVITDWHLRRREPLPLTEVQRFHQESDREKERGDAIDVLLRLYNKGLIDGKTVVIIQSGMGRGLEREVKQRLQEKDFFPPLCSLQCRSKPAQIKERFGINIALWALGQLTRKPKERVKFGA